MSTAHPIHTGLRRSAFSLPELAWLLAILVLLLAILLPSLSRARELAKRAVCSANMRGLGQGMHIYANENEEWFPHHCYAEPPKVSTSIPPEHSVRWVGTMGSNDFLRVSQATSATRSPDRNHPSRSLFLFVISGMCSPKQFVCPSSRDTEDPLRNVVDGRSVASRPGVDRFDFNGYNNLSYGYQLPFGRRAKPRNGLDCRAAVAADKGPYYAPGGEGLPGSGTVRDKRSIVDVPSEWQTRRPEDLLSVRNEEWRKYNSRNHAGEGQDVLFVDGHVEFVKRPIVGVNYDNIYTLQASYTLSDSLIGMVPDPEQRLGPLTNTDSFIVP